MPFADALTTEEIQELLEAAEMNGQIGLISADEDISNFFAPLLESQHDNRRLTDDEYKKWRRHFGLEPSESSDVTED